MTAREYLSQAFHIDQRINSKLEQVTRLRENRDELHGGAVGHASAGFAEQAADGRTPSARSWIWSGRSTRTSTGWWT